MAAPKMTKNQMRRAKKKEQKKAAKEEVKDTTPSETPAENYTKQEEDLSVKKEETKEQPTAEPVVSVDDLEDADSSAYAMYRDIFAKFGATTDEDEVAKEANAGNQGSVFFDDDDQIPDEDSDAENGQPKLSKKKRKQLTKLSVAELKALVRIPEVVEWHDVSSTDPRLLVQIKAQRNVVPVPTHWSLKREYLSSKRGIEKAPFRLPAFISETGITEMRDATLEKQAEQSLKQKQRERVAPKMGRLDIDYQKLYDAFFRFQTKPDLTRFGEVYYEGKESEVDYQHFRPGDLSDALKEALGIPPGAPPPWLINQQRIGTPPSYPTLKLPGLNAPPPPGGSWGFHPGGWGKPPVDEYNRPLYGGDVFGLAGPNGASQQPGGTQTLDQPLLAEPVERTLWGELQPREDESEEEEEEDSDEEDEEDEDEDDEGRPSPADRSGLETPAGLETPDASGVETSIAGEMDLRKQRRGYETEESSAPRSAYTVLPERQVRAEGFFGSGHGYDIPAAGAQHPVLGVDDQRKRKKPGDVDVALDPDTLQSADGISRDDLRRQYDEGRREAGPGAQWSYDDDLSEMIAQEARKRQRTENDRREARHR